MKKLEQLCNDIKTNNQLNLDRFKTESEQDIKAISKNNSNSDLEIES